MILDSATLRNLADIIVRYCALQNEVLDKFFTDIYTLSDEWQDDESFSQMMENIRILTNQSKQYFEELCTTYPPIFNKMADYIDSRPAYNSTYSPSGQDIGFGSSSGFSVRPNTDLSGKVQIPSDLVGIADFGNLDPQVSNIIVGTLMRTKETFPELQLNFVGSTQARNKGIKAELVSQYSIDLRAKYPDWTDADILSAARELAEQATSDLSPRENELAVAMTGTGVYDQYSGISFNESHAWKAENLNAIVARDVQTGYSAEGCYGAKAVMDHELGHAIDKLVGASTDPFIVSQFKKFSKLSDQAQRKMLSGYASTNIAEFIAESWMEFQNNPNCREFAQAIGVRIMQLYENTTSDSDSNPPVRRLIKKR